MAATQFMQQCLGGFYANVEENFVERNYCAVLEAIVDCISNPNMADEWGQSSESWDNA
jgi:hypothetical protein